MTPSSRTIRTLIVDDEALARQLLRTFLAEHPDFEIVGEAANGVDAVTQILQHHPDLVFLDIRMPLLDGLKVVRNLPPEQIPIIVYVTAFDQFALEAFELDAIDYLLKPFDQERFSRTLKRIRDHIGRVEEYDTDPHPPAAPPPTNAPETPAPASDRLLVRANGRLFFARTEEVQWVEAQGNYIALRIRDQSYLLRQTMQLIERQLDPNRFQRIQRSIIVNIDAVQELHPLFRGDYMVLMRDGTKLRMSSKYRQNFSKYMLGSL